MSNGYVYTGEQLLIQLLHPQIIKTIQNRSTLKGKNLLLELIPISIGGGNENELLPSERFIYFNTR